MGNQPNEKQCWLSSPGARAGRPRLPLIHLWADHARSTRTRARILRRADINESRSLAHSGHCARRGGKDKGNYDEHWDLTEQQCLERAKVRRGVDTDLQAHTFAHRGIHLNACHTSLRAMHLIISRGGLDLREKVVSVARAVCVVRPTCASTAMSTRFFPHRAQARS